jgi:hypothetical protein
MGFHNIYVDSLADVILMMKLKKIALECIGSYRFCRKIALGTQTRADDDPIRNSLSN